MPMLGTLIFILLACLVPRCQGKYCRSCVHRWASQTRRKCRSLPSSSSKAKVSPGPQPLSAPQERRLWAGTEFTWTVFNSGMGPLCR